MDQKLLPGHPLSVFCKKLTTAEIARFLRTHDVKVKRNYTAKIMCPVFVSLLQSQARAAKDLSQSVRQQLLNLSLVDLCLLQKTTKQQNLARICRVLSDRGSEHTPEHTNEENCTVIAEFIAERLKAGNAPELVHQATLAGTILGLKDGGALAALGRILELFTLQANIQEQCNRTSAEAESATPAASSPTLVTETGFLVQQVARVQEDVHLVGAAFAAFAPEMYATVWEGASLPAALNPPPPAAPDAGGRKAPATDKPKRICLRLPSLKKTFGYFFPVVLLAAVLSLQPASSSGTGTTRFVLPAAGVWDGLGGKALPPLRPIRWRRE